MITDTADVLRVLQERSVLHPGAMRWRVLRASSLEVLAEGDGPPRWALPCVGHPPVDPLLLAVGVNNRFAAVAVSASAGGTDRRLSRVGARDAELDAVAFEMANTNLPVAGVEVVTAATVIALATTLRAGFAPADAVLHDPALWVVLAHRVASHLTGAFLGGGVADRDMVTELVSDEWPRLADAAVAGVARGADWVDAADVFEATLSAVSVPLVLARLGWDGLAGDPRAGAVLLATPEFREGTHTLQRAHPSLFAVVRSRAGRLARLVVAAEELVGTNTGS